MALGRLNPRIRALIVSARSNFGEVKLNIPPLLVYQAFSKITCHKEYNQIYWQDQHEIYTMDIFNIYCPQKGNGGAHIFYMIHKKGS